MIFQNMLWISFIFVIHWFKMYSSIPNYSCFSFSLTSLRPLSKNKDSLLMETELDILKYHSAPKLGQEDQMEVSSLLPLDPTLECHSPPPDYNFVLHYSTLPM
ncbi:Hypothetical predicted protein [Marmota monax]|uniref:Uncharacterized protein n=1 Tax=Marmota monax TaxID=9995 RepID=A0A5E4CVR1_MARMO|nr:hypothetical protein GHT09_013772 [Marmota monax]VTJ85924.1 Hypothetical predicted protein [Marmota monax]